MGGSPGVNEFVAGDANRDGNFNSADLVQSFQRGEYEDQIEGNSTWEDGDWDGDALFNSSDFVIAFTDGGYELGPKMPAQAVPEPTIPFYTMLYKNVVVRHVLVLLMPAEQKAQAVATISIRPSPSRSPIATPPQANAPR